MICAQPITHTIKSGDSLWLIARDHGTTVQEIMNMNPGLDPYNLQLGTQIYVCENTLNPAVDQKMGQTGVQQNMTGQMGQLPQEGTVVSAQPATHTIKAGDSIWLIARAYGMSVQEIMGMNPGIDPYNLQTGTEIAVRKQAVPARDQGMGQTMAPGQATAGGAGQAMGGSGNWQNQMMNGGSDCLNQMMPDQTMSGNAGWQNQGMMDQTQPGQMANGNTNWQNQGMMDQTMPGQMMPEDMPPTEIVPETTAPGYMTSHGGNWNQPMPERDMTLCPPCPGTGSAAAGEATARMQQKQELNNQMRQAWTQHIYWIRMLMISILDRGEDQRAVTSRLLENPADITAVFAGYYPAENTDQIDQLLKAHLQDGASLVTALRGGDRKRAEELNKNLYANGQQLAAAFSQMNPYYNQKALEDMIYSHIDRGNRQTVNRLAKNYKQDIKEFDKAEEETMKLADYLTEGINQQFLG